MSTDHDTVPKIKLNDQKMPSEDADSFDKKLEEMKAEIEELENDFSMHTLDKLTKGTSSTFGMQPGDGSPDNLEDALEEEMINKKQSLLELKDNRKMSALSVPEGNISE